ncbi:hypothetical protein PENSTE_c018G06054 [Penicillium steckii]|uniref:Transmembrane protein n=1 Tax=Penicillium steckii TaxID=303698 RepID=A0A1V6SXI3_9EURO|nr:hypothetical protein PENSTE_c018G06054 [Penicillium steckii]
MQTFDSASRGPFGSMMMLFQNRISLASFGAVVIILSLAFDPFVQQIVTYPTRLAPTSEAPAVTKRLMAFVPSASAVQWDIAYASGIWADDNVFHPSCPSGNCIWPQFRSVGTCSQCAVFHASCQIDLPFRKSPNFTVEVFIEELPTSNLSSMVVFPRHLTWTVRGLQTHTPEYANNLTFAGTANPFLVLASANMEYNSTGIPPEDPIKALKITNITECSIALCLADYNGSVNNGVVETKISGVDFGHSFPRNFTVTLSTEPPKATTDILPCWRPTISPQNASFDMDIILNSSHGRQAAKPWSAILSSSEFEFCGINFVLPSRAFLEGTIQLFILAMGLGPFAVDPTAQRIASIGLEAVMSNGSSSLNKMALRADGEDVKGTAYSIQVFVEVQWPWLILPGLLLLFGVCVFALTILSSKRHSTPVWKSSVLALIYHGLSGDVVDDFDHSTASKMESRAEITSVRLQMPDGKRDLMLRQERALPD